MDNNIIGKYIEKKRKSKGLTQKELAKRLGLSNTAISKWECGCNLPDVGMLEPLSKELGVDVSKLVALQSGHVNYQSIEDLEEPEENPPTSNNNESNLTDNKFHITKKNIIFLTIIILLIITTNILTANFSHSLTSTPIPQSEVKVYEIISEDPNFNIRGFLIYNNDKHLILIKEFKYQSTIKGTNGDSYIKNITIYMHIDDQVVFMYQKDLNNNEKLLLNEVLERIDKNNFNDDDSEVDICSLEGYFNTSEIKLEYLTDKNEKEEINIKIMLKQAFT